jgi:hypothetical protein
VLAENAAMLTVLRRVFRTARTAFAGAELTMTMPVADEFGVAGPIDDLAA